MGHFITSIAGADVRVNPFKPVTSAVVTTTTAVAIKAGTSGKRLFITKISAVNKTTGEYPSLVVKTDNASPVTLGHIAPGAPTATAMKARDELVFDPPYEVPAGEGITAETNVVTVGDSYVTAMGYIED